MRRFSVLLAIATLAGCFSGRRTAPQCTGPVMATVRNDWNYSVDVYARMRGTSGHILGEVMPGERREFQLPDGATGLYYEVRTRAVIPRPTGSDIITTYTCR